MTARRAGQARLRGKLEVPQGRFALRPGMASPGAMPLVEALRLVEAEWDRQVAAGTISRAVIKCYRLDARSMVKFLPKRFGVNSVGEVTPNQIYEWMRTPRPDGEPPAANTRYGRRSAARAFFLTCTLLGIFDVNPAESISEKGRRSRFVNALTDEQIRQLCVSAPFTLTETKTPAALALMMIGAGTREVAYVRVCDVDLAHARVWVHDGGERFTARWLPIDNLWALEALSRRVSALAARIQDPLAYAAMTVAYERGRKKAPDTPEARQAAISMTLTTLMRKARVYRAGENRVESIREWVAARVFASTGSVAAVAQRLGMSSLDAAAHIVGYDWVAAHRINAEPPAEPGASGDRS